MSRMKMAENLAITDGYWRAYLDGLADKHRIRDNTDHEAEAIERSRIRTEQDAVNFHLDRMQQATERYAFPHIHNPADLGAPRVP